MSRCLRCLRGLGAWALAFIAVAAWSFLPAAAVILWAARPWLGIGPTNVDALILTAQTLYALGLLVVATCTHAVFTR